MDYNRRRSGRGRRPGNSSSESRRSRPNPAADPASTWAQGVESVNMSQPQNNVNAPVGGPVVNIVTVNRSDGENTPTTNVQHGDFYIPSSPFTVINQDPEDFRDFATTARADHEIYSNQLLTKQRGFPLWVPGPGMQLPIQYRRQGISIGDIGIITSTGEFDFLFNIFHPADHPINRGLVPPGFSPLSLEDLVCDIQRTTVYGPNTYLAGSSVRKTNTNWIRQVFSYASEAAIGQTFESTATEAAILVMPDGAATQNLLNTWQVRLAISRYAKDWYRYARYTRGRDIRNGDIRVVVGIDKVASWGIATSSCNTDQTASFAFKHDSTHFYRWECIGGSGRVGPQKIETHDLREGGADPQNQCIFVRTINFTLSGKMWNDFPSEAIQQPNSGPSRFDQRDSFSSNRGGTKDGNLGSGSTSSGHHPGPMPGSFYCISSVKFGPVELGANHPSAVIHDYLHEQFPDADLVITEDMDWISVLNDDDVDFPEPEDLCERIMEAHKLQNRSGVVEVLRKDGTQSRPRSMNFVERLRKLLPGRFSKAEDFLRQASECFTQYEEFHRLSDLETTIGHYRNALANSDKEHYLYPSILINLAMSLTNFGGRATVDPGRYSEPIDLLNRARKYMETNPPSDRSPIYPAVLMNLGRLYLGRYMELHADADLRASIEAYEHVRSSTLSGSLLYCSSLVDHAAALWTAYELQPQKHDVCRLDQALTYLEEARQGNHSELEGNCFKHLAATHDLLYRAKYSRDFKNAITHLNSAIEFNQHSVRLLRIKAADPDLSPTLSNLAKQQFTRFLADNNKDDLNNAELNTQEAKTLAVKEHGSEELLKKIDRLANNIKQYKRTGIRRRASRESM